MIQIWFVQGGLLLKILNWNTLSFTVNPVALNILLCQCLPWRDVVQQLFQALVSAMTIPCGPGWPPKPGLPLSPFMPSRPGRPLNPGGPGWPFGPNTYMHVLLKLGITNASSFALNANLATKHYLALLAVQEIPDFQFLLLLRRAVSVLWRSISSFTTFRYAQTGDTRYQPQNWLY